VGRPVPVAVSKVRCGVMVSTDTAEDSEKRTRNASPPRVFLRKIVYISLLFASKQEEQVSRARKVDSIPRWNLAQGNRITPFYSAFIDDD
jgi:hypothetical protein